MDETEKCSCSLGKDGSCRSCRDILLSNLRDMLNVYVPFFMEIERVKEKYTPEFECLESKQVKACKACKTREAGPAMDTMVIQALPSIPETLRAEFIDGLVVMAAERGYKCSFLEAELKHRQFKEKLQEPAKPTVNLNIPKDMLAGFYCTKIGVACYFYGSAGMWGLMLPWWRVACLARDHGEHDIAFQDVTVKGLGTIVSSDNGLCLYGVFDDAEYSWDVSWNDFTNIVRKKGFWIEGGDFKRLMEEGFGALPPDEKNN